MVIIINIAVFLVGIFLLFIMQKKKLSFNVLVLTGLVGGIILGGVFHQLYANADQNILTETSNWISLVGVSYVRLLKMMAIPLIFISIVCAIINQKSSKMLGKMFGLVLLILLSTTAISAVVGGATAKAFDLTAVDIQVGEKEQARSDKLETQASSRSSIQETLTNIIPDNPIYAMAGQGASATLSVVFFACLMAIGILGVRTYLPEQAAFIEKVFNAFQSVIVEVVFMILALTPYGIFALMINTVAGSDYSSIMKLATFVVASYVAIFIMFIVHGLVLLAFKLNPFIFYKKSLATLSCAFTSRTSAGTLPLTTKTLSNDLGVSEGISNLAASLGVSIGQNGCAGIYPAMLVMMVAPAVGVDITPTFFITMIVVVTFASIGIAGVGGGATFAGITVLSALGLPVGLAGLLISIEPLIDMARTALNVSGSMIAAVSTAKMTNQLDLTKYNDQSMDLSVT